MKTKLEKFYIEMKKFVNDDDYCSYTMSDYLSEIGEMMNRYDLSTEDLQEIVDSYPNDSDVERFVKGQLDFEIEEKKETDNINILLKNSGVLDIDNFYRCLKKLGYKISLI